MSKILLISAALTRPFLIEARRILTAPVNAVNGRILEDLGILLQVDGKVNINLFRNSLKKLKPHTLQAGKNDKLRVDLTKVAVGIGRSALKNWPYGDGDPEWEYIGGEISDMGVFYQIIDALSYDNKTLVTTLIKRLSKLEQAEVKRYIKFYAKESKSEKGVTPVKGAKTVKLTSTQLLKSFNNGDKIKASPEVMETLLKALKRAKAK